MCKLLNPKFLFIVFLVFISIVIKSCENFQLKDLGETAETDGAVEEKPKKYQFRKLNVKNVNFDTDGGEDEDEGSFTFMKVRTPSFGIKNRDSKPSKFADILNSDDDDSDSGENSDDNQEEESPSFFSKFMSFFKREPKPDESESVDDQEKSSDEIADDENSGSGEESDELDDSEDEIEEKPEKISFLDSIFEKVTGG